MFRKQIRNGMSIIRAMQPGLNMGLIFLDGSYTPACGKQNPKDVETVIKSLWGDVEGRAKLRDNIYAHIGLVTVCNTKNYEN